MLETWCWASKELPAKCIGLFIDAYHTEMRQGARVRKVVCFVVLGIDFEGLKDLWGVYVHSGSESKEYWLTVFNDLIERGPKRPLYAVSDDFAGLREAIKASVACCTSSAVARLPWPRPRCMPTLAWCRPPAPAGARRSVEPSTAAAVTWLAASSRRPSPI